MLTRCFISLSLILCFLISTVLPVVEAAAGEVPKERSSGVTTEDPFVPSDELALILKAFTKEELLVEAGDWQLLLREKAIEIGKAEIAVKRQNREIEKAEDIQDKAKEASRKLKRIDKKIDGAKTTGDAEEILETKKSTREAQELVGDISEMIDEAAEAAADTAAIKDTMDGKEPRGLKKDTVAAVDKAEKALGKVEDAVTGADLDDRSSVRAAAERAEEANAEAKQATARVKENVDKALEQVDAASGKAGAMQVTETVMEQVGAKKMAEKVELLKDVNLLREERTLIIDNFKTVLTELAAKTDDADSDTQSRLKDFQLYSRAVQGIHLDVTDTTSSWIAIKGWLVSDEGGLRFALNFLRFSGILFVAWLLAKVASRLLHRALGMSRKISRLLGQFLEGAVRWVVMAAGIIMALAALEVSVAPLLAMVGAAGFIIALALQDSLSNFASGMMILFFRPFDEDDNIDAGGVSGKVTSVSLVSTTIMTFDNKKMLVPNNKIWNDVITNATDVKTRRIDMEFGVSYDNDIHQVQTLLEEIVHSHPKVLKKPEPVVRLQILADSSVNFICRPWIKAVDYWEVYWDIIKTVKLRFDEENISLPYPQQDVHLYIEKKGE